jgi:hypothetical protein
MAHSEVALMTVEVGHFDAIIHTRDQILVC